MVSHLNVLLRENEQLREALRELIHAAELYMGETPDNVLAKARAALGVALRAVAWLRPGSAEPISDALKRADPEQYQHHTIPLVCACGVAPVEAPSSEPWDGGCEHCPRCGAIEANGESHGVPCIASGVKGPEHG
jgi:hypothetical protein